MSSVVDVFKVDPIGEKIFGYLDFKDLTNCRAVNEEWYDFLNEHEQRGLWIRLLEKERLKLVLERPLTPAGSEEYMEGDLGDPCSTDYLLRHIHLNDHFDNDIFYIEDENGDTIDEFDFGCEECRESRQHAANVAKNSWFWLINAVKNGQIADMICLIPKVCHFRLFGNISVASYIGKFQQDYFDIFKLLLKYDAGLDLPEFLRFAILSENMEMVKHIAPKVDMHQVHQFTEENFLNMADETRNAELIEYIESFFLDDSDSSENSEDWEDIVD